MAYCSNYGINCHPDLCRPSAYIIKSLKDHLTTHSADIDRPNQDVSRLEPNLKAVTDEQPQLLKGTSAISISKARLVASLAMTEDGNERFKKYQGSNPKAEAGDFLTWPSIGCILGLPP